MLEEMQRQQAAMTGKIDELVVAKVQKMKDKIMSELRALWKALGNRTPAPEKDQGECLAELGSG
jgi:hypothetical protein